ncbi:type I restriction modification DNA specificity protein [Arcicella aurantiaca]|uniref:Type I restriction modification DNA specificity protein n=1 Tax=Arcicella aurantiaca TaxID=591202 RepID=A0A316E7B5_9BACT|nr:restriction endonuclease subunit S [Arcicella aurantiaca]PWK26324.1 type I restriction modification DNA specificity protein [Arcicella aurantiaca]
MEKQLKDVNWGEFYLKDIFKDIQRGKRLKKNNHIEGKIPYISSTGINNGVDNFVGNINNVRIFSNCLTIANSGSVGVSFYQSFYFVASDHITKLKNENFEKYVYLFLSMIVSQLGEKYSFNREINDSRIYKERILLPMTPQEQPDYVFMEEYMREKEQEKINAFQKQIAQRIVEVKNYKEVIPLSEKEWKAFKIGDLFIKLEQGKSKGLNHLRKTNLGVNYLGATNLNNGVLCQVEKQNNLIQKGNSIAFIRNGEGSMGYAIYKLEDFIATSDISVGYSPELNRYVGLFITTVADRVRGKYNFGYKRSGERLRKESILLPINTNGQPDYEYMEHYIKKIEYQKLMAFLEMKKISL